jgi:hypothetical protein
MATVAQETIAYSFVRHALHVFFDRLDPLITAPLLGESEEHWVYTGEPAHRAAHIQYFGSQFFTTVPFHIQAYLLTAHPVCQRLYYSRQKEFQDVTAIGPGDFLEQEARLLNRQ